MGKSLRPLYGLNLIVNSTSSELVLVSEGEKCASALQSLGYVEVGPGFWRNRPKRALNLKNAVGHGKSP